jgi:ComF family protein
VLAVAANSLVRTVLSPGCAACDAELDRPLASPVCDACWAGVLTIAPPTCVCCGDALASSRDDGPWCLRCRRREPAFELARSAGRYDGSLRLIIHAFKYGRRRALARPLAALMRKAGADLLASVDAAVPVPLHPARSLRRGFNQADDLARELGLPVWRVLRRVRHGPPQADLPAAGRHANVQSAFVVRCGPAGSIASWRPALRNRSVLLVDDVMTTGATLDACGRALLETGVRRVSALTVARTAPPRPSGRRPPPRPSTVRHQ